VNIWRQWFAHVFHAKNGPAQLVKAFLVRYAGNFFIMAYCALPCL
jgi:hypothetical protein